MLTLTKAISLLGKKVWVVWYGPHQYGWIKRGMLAHVSIHAEKLGRGEWHAYVSARDRGWDYAGEDIFLTKDEAESELQKRVKDGAK